MGKRGPVPQPTALKALRGNPGKRPLNKREPKPARGLPDPPRWLHGDARREWRRIAGVLWDAGLLTLADHDALATLCETTITYRRAMATVQNEGPIIESVNGALYQHPALGIANRARVSMLALWREFGLTPSARSRLQVDADGDNRSIAELLDDLVMDL